MKNHTSASTTHDSDGRAEAARARGTAFVSLEGCHDKTHNKIEKTNSRREREKKKHDLISSIQKKRI
jgi:hypothetical protein